MAMIVRPSRRRFSSISMASMRVTPTSSARSSTLGRPALGRKGDSRSPCRTGRCAVTPSARRKARREDFIVTIDRSDDQTAFIKVRCQLPPRYFTDYLVAFKMNDNWTIVSKSYRYDVGISLSRRPKDEQQSIRENRHETRCRHCRNHEARGHQGPRRVSGQPFGSTRRRRRHPPGDGATGAPACIWPTRSHAPFVRAHDRCVPCSMAWRGERAMGGVAQCYGESAPVLVLPMFAPGACAD